MDVIGESSEPPAPPDSFHVFFHSDSATLPGTLVASRLANPYSGFFTFVITLTSPVMLAEGTYWVSVQAREDYAILRSMVLGQSVGYIQLWGSLAKPWRRLWGELPYLGPQD